MCPDQRKLIKVCHKAKVKRPTQSQNKIKKET
jgi:hypothetical protein